MWCCLYKKLQNYKHGLARFSVRSKVKSHNDIMVHVTDLIEDQTLQINHAPLIRNAMFFFPKIGFFLYSLVKVEFLKSN